MRRLQIWLLMMAVSAVTTACVTAPAAIRTPVAGPSVGEALRNPDKFLGVRVRWGGTIVQVENRQTETWLQVVARGLARGGRPLTTAVSPGRFIAKISGFVDPEIYERDRDFTVVGLLEPTVTKRIGDYPYRFPTVRVETHYLWEPLPDYDPYYYYPYYWDPFYYPGWPYHPHYYRYRHWY